MEHTTRVANRATATATNRKNKQISKQTTNKQTSKTSNELTNEASKRNITRCCLSIEMHLCGHAHGHGLIQCCFSSSTLQSQNQSQSQRARAGVRVKAWGITRATRTVYILPSNIRRCDLSSFSHFIAWCIFAPIRYCRTTWMDISSEARCVT